MCKPNKRRGQGRVFRDPRAVGRKLGMSRRYSRKSLGRDAQD